MPRKAPPHGESGFALLFVFFMAAAIAISFYIQLPVAVFENQRTREQALLDPLEGAADLRAKRIRVCSRNALTDDPIRVLRGVRLAAMLGFHIEPQTRSAMREAAPLPRLNRCTASEQQRGREAAAE